MEGHAAEIKKALTAGVPAEEGRTDGVWTDADDLAREYEPSAESIRNWVKQAECDVGERQDGLTTD